MTMLLNNQHPGAVLVSSGHFTFPINCLAAHVATLDNKISEEEKVFLIRQKHGEHRGI